MSKIVKGVARAFSDKRGWWGMCLSTPDGDIWISPGVKSDQPCPAVKGQVVTAEVEGAFNKVIGSIKVETVSATTAAPVNKAQQQTGFKPRNNYGTQVGHAINGAFDLLGFKASIEEVIEASMFIAEKTNELKVVFAANNPALSEYDVGASVGHAIRNAAKIIQAREWDAEKIVAVALGILERVNPAVLAFVQELDTPKTVVYTPQVESAPPTELPVVVEAVVEDVTPEPVVVVVQDTIAAAVVEEAPAVVTKPKAVRQPKAVVQEAVVVATPEVQVFNEENLDDDLPW